MDYLKMIAELQKQMQANTAEMEVLIQLAKTEDNRDLTEDEQTKFDGFVVRNDDLEKRVKNLEKLQAQQQRSDVSTTIKDFSKDKKEPDAVTEPESLLIDAADIKLPAVCRTAYNLRGFSGADAPKRAFRFGKWMLGALNHKPSQKWCKDIGLGYQAVHEEAVNTTGGYLVPTQLDGDIISLILEYGLARQLCRITPMTTDTLNRPRRTGGLTATFTGESVSATESTKSWDNVSLTAKKLTALTRITNELNEDAIINVADDLVREIAIAFAEKEDKCLFIGDGTTTYGGIQGYEAKFDAIGTTSGGGLQVSTGNLFSETTMTDLVNFVARLPSYADNPNTKIVMNRLIYFDVVVRLLSALGGNTVQTIEALTRRQLWGYPVMFSNAMPKADANSQVFMLMGDFALSSMFGDRRSRTISFSDSATIGSDNVFEDDQIAVRGTERFDINVHDVGDSSTAGPVIALMSKAS